MDDLRERLSRVPRMDVPVGTDIAGGVEDSVRYLASDEALASIERDPYWPKWHSPWWHMLALFEVGEARQIPQRAARQMVDRVNAMPVHVFPIHPEDMPQGADYHRDTLCHCAVGSLDQVLTACGVDVAAELPWLRAWYARYQLADGGLNCDRDAYLVKDECPSSMVGTIAPFEAMMAGGDRSFVDRCAAFLIGRRLVEGSSTRHNAEERDSARSWPQVCFPRFYFYDVLRGLSALARWSEQTGRALPLEAVAPAVEHLLQAFPDGVVVRQRRAMDGKTTIAPDASGAWVRMPASTFPLLDALSVVGQPCPFLTRQWSDTRARLLRVL